MSTPAFWYNRSTRDDSASGYMTEIYKEIPMIKSIPLSQGKIALIDDEDYERVSKHKWHVLREHYAGSSIGGKQVYLHRFVINAPSGMQVDHINMDKLDCRKSNLRLCDNSQNHANKGPQRNNTTGYKGVVWDKFNKKWIAQIHMNGKNKKIGRFLKAEEAARAYDDAAKIYFGDFARLNFPC